MSNTDREEFKQRMRNLDAEEKKIVVNYLPNEILVEELNRRLTIMADKISQIKEVLRVQETN